MATNLELALEYCLEQLARGASIEECLAQYEQLRAELKPLLLVAQQTASLAQVNASDEFRHRGRTALLAYVRANPRRRATGMATRNLRFASMAAVLVLALSTTGTALAQGALPGDSLYSWKLASEQVWRTFQQDKLRADQSLAQRRLDELASVQDDVQLKMASAGLYTQAVEQVRQVAEDHPEQIDAVNQFLADQQTTVLSVITDVEATLPDVQRILGIITTVTDLPLVPDLTILPTQGSSSPSPASDNSSAPADSAPKATPDSSTPDTEAPADTTDSVSPLQDLRDLIDGVIDLLP